MSDEQQPKAVPPRSPFRAELPAEARVRQALLDRGFTEAEAADAVVATRPPAKKPRRFSSLWRAGRSSG